MTVLPVIVDTCVWSLALRRPVLLRSPVEAELASLVLDGRILMIGPIRQEILSGIREPAQFRKLRQHLAAFPDVPLLAEDYETAAAYFNRCRSKGIQGSNTDFLICAVATRLEVPVFTTDKDFLGFAKCVPVMGYEWAG